VWTDRGRDVEDISAGTGDTTRAPTGLALWGKARRPLSGFEPEPGTHKWPSIATVNLIWDPEP
jgi:hypothetical protein